MIRKSQDLLSTLRAGNTVSWQGVYEGAGKALSVCQTGESVHGQAFNVLRKKDMLLVVSVDMCGEPLEYGCTPA